MAARFPAEVKRPSSCATTWSGCPRSSEHDRLQDSCGGSVPSLGEQFSRNFGSRSVRLFLLAGELRGACAAPRRPARPIRVLVGSARDEGLLALTLGSFDPELKIAFDFRHDSWEGVESDLPPDPCVSTTSICRSVPLPAVA